MSVLAELDLQRQRRLRRVEYERLVAHGCFDEERVELLYGRLMELSPHGPLHSRAIVTLNGLLTPAVLGRALVLPQCALIAADDSEPEPDLAVVPPGDYRAEHPRRAWLVVEVADSSLRRDLRIKAPLYAASGFREYWVVDLPNRQVHVHRAPEDGQYAQITACGPGDRLAPEAFPEVEVDLSALFG